MTAVSSMNQDNKTKDSFFKKHTQKLIALTVYLAILGLFYWYTKSNGLSATGGLLQIYDIVNGSAIGPLIFITLYALRPVLFISAALLSIMGGLVFGPVLGILYTVIGSNMGAMLAFGIGRYFGNGVLNDDGNEGFIASYAERMRKDSFVTVLIMRFIFLPYDLVNYLAGFLQINWKPFLLATILGSIPGTISFSLFGASISIDELANGELPSLDPKILAASFVILVASIALSRVFKKREGIQ